MQICKEHWNKIRQAIVDHGLDHLGAHTSEQAHADMVATIEGEETPFDPLMSCNWMITSRALEIGGLYLMTRDYCPICEATIHRPDDMTIEDIETYWIDGPADAALETARELRLVAPPQ